MFGTFSHLIKQLQIGSLVFDGLELAFLEVSDFLVDLLLFFGELSVEVFLDVAELLVDGCESQ